MKYFKLKLASLHVISLDPNLECSSEGAAVTVCYCISTSRDFVPRRNQNDLVSPRIQLGCIETRKSENISLNNLAAHFEGSLSKY